MNNLNRLPTASEMPAILESDVRIWIGRAAKTGAAHVGTARAPLQDESLSHKERHGQLAALQRAAREELGRLAGSSGHGVHARRTETAVEQARRFGATLVAKGPRSVIAAADGRVWINGTGGPALASGGTGDVLTGITAAMMAQHRDPASVAAAVHVHGLAGDLAAEHLSARATGASDVADHVAAAALELGI